LYVDCDWQRLITSGAGVVQRDKNGFMPLHVGVQHLADTIVIEKVSE